MPPITSEKVTIDRIVELQLISRQTFYETFADGNTEANMTQYLDEGFSIAKLTSELNNPNSSFYFATSDGAIIGYLKLNVGSAQTEMQDENPLEIERIYVLKAYQGQGVGQLLYDKAIEIARQMSAAYVWLGVWEKNPRAISFYKKNGFVAFDTHIFILGNDRQTDIMMRLEMAY
jgi:ribosomal protein S18 acetylase RimI-like enzyme